MFILLIPLASVLLDFVYRQNTEAFPIILRGSRVILTFILILSLRYIFSLSQGFIPS